MIEATPVRRILAIDGGGIKGVFPASFLATVEDAIQAPVADYFDLIVGTSTGGIIALALGLEHSAADILAFYEESGPAVFRRSRFGAIRQWLWPRYDPAPLRRALEARFGDRRLGESRVRLVVPSAVLHTGDVYVYKTAHAPRIERDHQARVVDVALATAAAPAYFPAHVAATGVPLVDGGVWASNPTGLAVVEAIGTLGWPPASLRVLSLGCTTAPVRVPRGRFGFGRAGWAMRVVDLLLTTQSFGSMGTAYVLTSPEQVLRVSPAVDRDWFSLDDVSQLPALRALGHVEARRHLPRIRQMFFGRRAETFTPFHGR